MSVHGNVKSIKDPKTLQPNKCVSIDCFQDKTFPDNDFNLSHLCVN